MAQSYLSASSVVEAASTDTADLSVVQLDGLVCVVQNCATLPLAQAIYPHVHHNITTRIYTRSMHYYHLLISKKPLQHVPLDGY